MPSSGMQRLFRLMGRTRSTVQKVIQQRVVEHEKHNVQDTHSPTHNKSSCGDGRVGKQQLLDTLEAADLHTSGSVYMVPFREDEAVSGIRQSTEPIRTALLIHVAWERG